MSRSPPSACGWFGVFYQFSALKHDCLGPIPGGGQPVSDARALLVRLEAAPAEVQGSYIASRLRAGLEYVRDTDSADTLEEHLRRLEDVELEKLSAGYALPRLVRATLPIVGMLGTVIGITLAIEQLSPDQLEQSLTSVMGALSVAFDTTAQAMSLMIVLWFAMFFSERVEQRLLSDVDRAASRALVGRFQQYGAATDPNVAAVRRMGEQVVTAVEQLAVRQADAWRSSIDATHEHWASTTRATGESLNTALREAVGANLREQADSIAENTKKFTGGIRDGLGTMAELLVESLRQHAASLTEAEQRLATENRKHLTEVEAAVGEAMVTSADRQEKLVNQSERLLNEVRDTLLAATDGAADHQRQLVRQSEVLERVIDSTGQIQRLEESLNQNLATLAQGHDFEDTVLSLSAAVQLLTARLNRDGGANSTGKAA